MHFCCDVKRRVGHFSLLAMSVAQAFLCVVPIFIQRGRNTTSCICVLREALKKITDGGNNHTSNNLHCELRYVPLVHT